MAYDEAGQPHQVKPLWMRTYHQIQRRSTQSKKRQQPSIRKKGLKRSAVIDYYLENARIMIESLKSQGHTVFWRINAPYVWVKTKNGLTSWEFFDHLLNEANVVGTPGSGFGPSGEGYFRSLLSLKGQMF